MTFLASVMVQFLLECMLHTDNFHAASLIPHVCCILDSRWYTWILCICALWSHETKNASPRHPKILGIGCSQRKYFSISRDSDVWVLQWNAPCWLFYLERSWSEGALCRVLAIWRWPLLVSLPIIINRYCLSYVLLLDGIKSLQRK